MNKTLRIWDYIFKCKHPFEKSTKISALKITKKNAPSNKNWEFYYVVNIRHCSLCDKHFIDEGWEFKDKILA